MVVRSFIAAAAIAAGLLHDARTAAESIGGGSQFRPGTIT